MRALHVLQRMGISSMSQLLATPIEDIANERNVGAKTIEQISTLVDQIHNGELPHSLIERLKESEGQHGSLFSAKPVVFPAWQLEEFSQHSINELGLSIRAQNRLERYSYSTMDKLVQLTEEDLLAIDGLGAKSCEEILSAISEWISENSLSMNENEEGAAYLETRNYFMRISEHLNPICTINWRILLKEARNTELIDRITDGGYQSIENENMRAVLELPGIRKCLKQFFMKLAPKGIIDASQFVKRIQEYNTTICPSLIIECLIDENICDSDSGLLFLKREKVSDYVSRLGSSRSDQVVLERLKGEILQTIGEHFHLTRERVRQITVNTISKWPSLYEDFFHEPFEAFKLSKDEFRKAFPACSDFGYEYLGIKYSRGKKTLNHETVSEYDGLFSREIHRLADWKDECKELRELSKNEIVRRVLLSNSESAMTLEELSVKYDAFITEKGLSERKYQVQNWRSVLNHLQASRHYVFNIEHKVRYFAGDSQLVIREIEFASYSNLVVSSELIYRDYEEVCQEQDIRDGYELFYVLKAALPAHIVETYSINFRRVPIIVFGDGNEEEQAKRLLVETAPIAYNDYYFAYEERYGVRHESAKGNPTIAATVSPFLVSGQYVTDAPCIDELDEKRFEQELQKRPVWFIDELERIFKECCTHSSMDALNAVSVRKIGYTLNSGYAYRSSFGNMTAFIEKSIFNGRTINLTRLDRRLVQLQTFGSILDKQKKNLNYIEYAPKILLPIEEITDLYDITFKEIKQFQQTVLNMDLPQFFNANSIWEMIRDFPIVQKMKDNKWMCTCIMRQQDGVYCLNVSGAIILSLDNEKAVSISRIAEWIVHSNGKMGIKQLTELINTRFGSTLNRSTIAEKLRQNNMWDSIVTDSIEDYIGNLLDDLDDDLFREEFF